MPAVELTAGEQARMRELALPDVITVTTDTESDDFDPVPTPGTPEDVPAYVVPMDATEDEINRDVRVSRYRVWAPPDAEISGTSAITWQGRSLQVIGEPLADSEGGLGLVQFIAREIRG